MEKHRAICTVAPNRDTRVMLGESWERIARSERRESRCATLGTMFAIRVSMNNANRSVEVSGIIVRSARMLGGRTVFSAWIRQASPANGCGTIMSDGAGWLGRVTTESLPAEIDAIPARVGGEWNEERFAAIDAWRAERRAAAYAAIVAAFPEAADGFRDMGEITI